MPLEAGNIGDLDEEPLPSGVLEAWLDNAQLHRALIWKPMSYK